MLAQKQIDKNAAYIIDNKYHFVSLHYMAQAFRKI